MTFLITEIALYLGIAVLLGAVVGWLFRHFSAKKDRTEWSEQLEMTRKERDRTQLELHELNAEHKGCGTRFQELVSAGTRLEGEIKEKESRIVQLEADLTNGVATLTQLKKQISDLESQLESQQSLYSRMTEQYEKLEDDKKHVEAQFKEQLQKSRSAIAEAKEIRELSADASGRIDALTAEKDKALAEVQSLKLQIAGLQTDLDEAGTLEVQANLPPHVPESSEESDAGKDTMSMSSADQEIYAELARSYSELKLLKEKYASVEEELIEANTLIVELKAGTGVHTRPTWILDAPDQTPNNLKQIKGIGPKLEKTLNELGIYYFSQIAQMEHRDIAWITEQLDTFPGRIIRDRWIEQAQNLTSDLD